MRRYTVFLAVSFSLVMHAINMSAVSVAFPVLVADYDVSLVLAGWVLSAFMLVSTTVMPLAGKVSEVLGQKPTIMAYTTLFVIGSALCAISPNIDILIGARVIQALGGGGFLPCAAVIVNDEFPEARQRYIGLFSSIFPIGMIIGPNLGGWMIEAFGWRSIFWFNVPLGIIVLILLQIFMKKSEKRKISKNIDFAGVGLLLVSLLALMWGMTELADSESVIPRIFSGMALLLGFFLLYIFWRQEHRVKEPVIDMELLKEKPFLAANLYNLFYGLAALGIFTLIPLYAVTIYDMTVFESGLVLTPRSIGMIAASTITSFSMVKWGYRKPILTGTLINGIGCFLLAMESQGIHIFGMSIGAVPLLYIILGLCGIGNGVCTPASNNACIELMPDKVATITGLRGLFRSLGSVIGVAIGTVVLHNMADIAHAFRLVLIGAGISMFIIIPAIFMMPASPNVDNSKFTIKKSEG
jgi:EmrB/QacA subfamily drug resistance transporter